MSHSAIKRLTYRVDLNETTRKVYLDGVFVTDDHEGHQFDLQLYRGSDPVQLPSGVAVHGYFTRYSDNTTLTLEKGTASGNVASIKLDKLCYALPGQFALVIKVMEGEAISALFYAEGSMVISKTGKVIDAGNVIPSLDELLAKIADMEAATADGRAAAQEARDAGTQAVGIAQGAAGEALAAAETVKSIYEVKADAIMDESARAASHSLHAQDGRLAVTLYGATTETGTGDKSPDNPYVISGEGVVHFLFNGSENWKKSSLAVEGYSSFYLSDTRFIDNRAFVICDTFRMGNYWEWSNLVQDEFIEIATGSVGIRVKNERATDLTTWKAWLASNPVNAWCQVKRGEAVDSVAVGLSGEGGRTAIGMPLLPDGSPLHGNGTVDDTIENDVLSGCDKKIVLDGTNANWNALDYSRWTTYAAVYTQALGDIAAGYQPYSNNIPGKVSANATNLYQYIATHTTINGYFYLSLSLETLGIEATSDINTVRTALNAYLAANPLTVYYRSTEYTPEKDLRVCKVVRRFGADGSILTKPETYMTDHLPLRKPTGMEEVTVTGSAETAVIYPHDTKHYIDSKISELVTLALANQ